MRVGPGETVWPRRRFVAPRSPFRVALRLFISLSVVALVTGILMVVISALFLRYPEHAASFGWRGVQTPADVFPLLFREPAGWLTLAFAFFLLLLLLGWTFNPPGEVVLMPDRLIIRDRRAVVELPYWQIERIDVLTDEGGTTWLTLQGAFERSIRLPLTPPWPMAQPARRALSSLLLRIPTWTQVAPEVERWAGGSAGRE